MENLIEIIGICLRPFRACVCLLDVDEWRCHSLGCYAPLGLREVSVYLLINGLEEMRYTSIRMSGILSTKTGSMLSRGELSHGIESLLSSFIIEGKP